MTAEDLEWKRSVERYNKRQARKIEREPMPKTEEECKRDIDDETHKCAWHSQGFNPARRVRLIAHAKANGWRWR